MRRVSGRYLCLTDADMRASMPAFGPTKNRPEKILAGHTCPRPFSYLFYVASKPAGSNDHEIHVVIRLHRLPVKAPKRLPSLSLILRSGQRPRLEGWAGCRAPSSFETVA